MARIPVRAADYQVYAISLRTAHNFMLREGYDPDKLLADTGLSAHDLEEPYNLIDGERARSYYLNLVNTADRDGIGLALGRTSSVREMGTHGLAMIAGANIEEALRRTHATRYNYNLLADWEVTIDGAQMVHTFVSDETDRKLRTFFIERAMSVVQAHSLELVGPDARPLQVTLDFEQPDYVALYHEVFDCPLHFSQDSCQIWQPAEWLRRELSHHDPQAQEVLEALQASLHDRVTTGGDVVQAVTSILRRSTGDYPRLESVAADLSMSARTLRRKLGQRGVRYQDLLDGERRRIAQDCLRNTTLTIQQIAERCGYADSQNFAQAFRRWTGTSPSDFRAASARR